MFLDGCNKIAGCLLIFFGVLFIAGGIIGGLLLPRLKDKAFMDLNKYDRDSKFNDPNYEKCDLEHKNVFFYNLTNPDQFLAGGRANLKLVGPYNFTREYCDFNETQDGKYKTYREYYKAPNFTQIEGSPFTENDIIVNVNPGYLGIMHSVQQKTGSDQNLELSFETNLAGPALESNVIAALQGEEFLSQVRAGALPTVLLTIRTKVADQQIEIQVRATFVASQITSSIAGIVGAGPVSQSEAALQFFNAGSIPFGYTTELDNDHFNGSTINFSNTTVQYLLYGNPTTGKPGWLTPTPSGPGLLYFLQTISNATTAPSLITDFNIADLQELESIGNYVNYLLYNGVDNILGSGKAQSTAYDEFYGQWANATLFSNGLDLNSDGHTPDGFELGTNADMTSISVTGLPLAAARNLWDATRNDSFLTMAGMTAWATALAKYSANSSDTAGLFQLAGTTGIPPTLVPVVANWLGSWLKTLVSPFVLQQFGVSSMDKLAYIQWGSAGVLDGDSVASHDPTIPAPPEWAIFVQNAFGFSMDFNESRSEELLNGTFGFMIGANIPNFLGLVQRGTASSFSQIQTIWGLNQTEALYMAAYFKYFIESFIDPFLLYQMFPLGGGPVTWRKPVEWLYTAVDPLIAFVGEDARVGFLFDDTEATSREDAESRPLIREEIWTGGNKDQLLEFFRVKEYKGNDTVTEWNPPLPVSGYPGNYWVPGSIKEDSVLTVWFDELARPTDWVKTKEIDLKGIHLWQFEPVHSIFENSTANPNNTRFSQKVTGLINITAISPLQTFISHGDWWGVDESVTSTVDGLNRTDYDVTWMFGVEPESGITMVQFATKCVSAGFPNLNRFYNISAGKHPIFYVDDYEEISDKDADHFKSQLNALRAGVIVFFVVGIIIGVILLAFGIAILWRLHRRSFEDDKNPLELHDIS